MKNNLQNSNTSEEKKIDWKVVQSTMKQKLGQDIFDSWLKKMDLIQEFNNYVMISVSTRFIRDWITSRYLDQILQIIKEYKKSIIRIEFVIEEMILHSSGNAAARGYFQWSPNKRPGSIATCAASIGTDDTLAGKVFPTSTTRLVLLSQEETTLLIWKGDKLSRSVNEEDLQPKPDSDEIESHQEKSVKRRHEKVNEKSKIN